MEKLTINSENGYLNLPDLPYDCIFNKVVTGCGGTTIVLRNEENYVIAVPTTELIINKTGSSEAGISTVYDRDIFGLFGTFSYDLKKLLKEYIASEGTKKIMCTYDKIPALCKLLDPSDYRLLVDEYHCLLKAYSYRQKAINGVLSHYRLFKSFCFMSATPISSDFKPSILYNVREVEAEWCKVDRLKVVLLQTNKPYSKAANFIKAYKKDGYFELNGKKSTEAYFFINSVTDIASILQYCNLSSEEVKIICANNESNRLKLEGYQISNSTDRSKKQFTFITSKSFEGADFFSEDAICYVVSNSGNENTLLDISTDIYQIAGRIRTATNPFRGMLVHIFNTTGRRDLELDITYDQMVQKVDKQVATANKYITAFNSVYDSEDPEEISTNIFNNNYVVKGEDGKYFLNDMLIKLELFNFRIEEQIYKKGIALRSAYSDTGAATSEVIWEEVKDKIDKVNRSISFKDAFIKYSGLKSRFCFDDSEAQELVQLQPLIEPAYYQLGVAKVRSLRYVKKAVEDALENLDSTKDLDNKVATLLAKRLKAGFYTNAQIREEIQAIYDHFGLADKVKATLITRYFDCKETSTRVNDKKVAGYMLYRPLLMIKTN